MVMDHCLLFGARGHLAQTKLIPNFKRQDVTYTCISRKQKVDLREHYNNKNVIAYMAIPTGRIMDHVEKYEDDFLRMKPTFVLEKPHGDSLKNFNEICAYFDYYEHDYLFNDHYMFKNHILRLDNLCSNFSDIHTIEVNIKECGCINDRRHYFETAGILLDMYQSHVVMIFAKVLAKIYPSESLTNILLDISETKFEILDSGRYDTYKGYENTYMTLSMKYKETSLFCTLKKNADYHDRDKGLYLYSDDMVRRMPLDDSDGYDTLVYKLRKGEHQDFLTRQQVYLLWKHIEYNESD